MKKIDLRNVYGKTPESFHDALARALEDAESVTAKKQRRRPVRYAAAFAAAAAVLSLGAISANAVFKSFAPVKEGNYGLNIGLDVSGSADENGMLTLNAASNAPEYVKVTFGYMPEDIFYDEQNGKYHSAEGLGVRGISFVMDRITEKQTFSDYNIDHYDTLSVNGHDAVIAYTTWTAEENEFTRRFYIYFEDMATFVWAFVTDDISQDELIKIMEGITVEACGAEESNVGSFSEAKKLYEEEKRDEAMTAFVDRVSEITEHHKYYPAALGTTVSFGDSAARYDLDGLSYSIDDIEVLDNIAQLDYNRFTDYRLDLYEDVDENGNILPYERKSYAYGDGVDAPFAAVTGTQTVGRRLVYVTMTVHNDADSDRSFMYQDFDLGIFKRDGDMLSLDDTAGLLRTEMCYCDNNNIDEVGMKAGWNFLTVGAGETQTVHIGFVADEDMLDDMYVVNSGYEDVFRYDSKRSEFETVNSQNLNGTSNGDFVCVKVR